jgi:glycosyltransferase involved in cell wall biosynthesis
MLRVELGLSGHVFLYVGRLWSKKGVDTLLKAYNQVREEKSDVSLLIVGSGPDGDRYRQISSSDPSIVFVDFVQPSQIPLYYGLADSFVFPTLGDPHGLVLDEAMAAGLPIISSLAAGDVIRRLGNGKAGMAVPPADIGALSEAMKLLANNSELCARFVKNGKQLVETRNHGAYAKDFEWFTHETLALPPRRNLATVATFPIGRVTRALMA